MSKPPDTKKPSDYVDLNRDTWERWTEVNFASSFYDVDGFKAGQNTGRSGLDRLGAELLGDVRGKRLLHLQCHFGMDSLTQARRGAIVTGVDYSAAAIARARDLASELGLEVRFVESSIDELPEALDGEFDIVPTRLTVSSPGYPICATGAASSIISSRPAATSCSSKATPSPCPSTTRTTLATPPS